MINDTKMRRMKIVSGLGDLILLCVTVSSNEDYQFVRLLITELSFV